MMVEENEFQETQWATTGRKSGHRKIKSDDGEAVKLGLILLHTY
jgi:hypothetical protein